MVFGRSGASLPDTVNQEDSRAALGQGKCGIVTPGWTVSAADLGKGVRKHQSGLWSARDLGKGAKKHQSGLTREVSSMFLCRCATRAQSPGTRPPLRCSRRSVLQCPQPAWRPRTALASPLTYPPAAKCLLQMASDAPHSNGHVGAWTTFHCTLVQWKLVQHPGVNLDAYGNEAHVRIIAFYS